MTLRVMLGSLVMTAAMTLQSPTWAGPIDLSTGSGGFGGIFGPGFHTEQYSFTLAQSGVVTSSLISASVGTHDLDFTSVSIRGQATDQFTPLLADPFEFTGLGQVTLAAGAYTLDVQVQVGPGGGSYGGNLSVSPLAGSAPVSGPAVGRATFLDLSTGTGAFFNSPGSGPFVDTYNFTLASPAFLSAAVTAASNGNQNVDFLSGTIIGGNNMLYAFSQATADPYESLVLQSALLPAGSYAVSLTGLNSQGAGSYGGNVVLSANALPTPVPEPSTWILFTTGVLLTGMVSHLRRPARGTSR